jgi:hypothetical protein
MTEFNEVQIEVMKKFIKERCGDGNNYMNELKSHHIDYFTEEQAEQVRAMGKIKYVEAFEFEGMKFSGGESEYVSLTFEEIVEIIYNGDYDKAIRREFYHNNYYYFPDYLDTYEDEEELEWIEEWVDGDICIYDYLLEYLNTLTIDAFYEIIDYYPIMIK